MTINRLSPSGPFLPESIPPVSPGVEYAYVYAGAETNSQDIFVGDSYQNYSFSVTTNEPASSHHVESTNDEWEIIDGKLYYNGDEEKEFLIHALFMVGPRSGMIAEAGLVFTFGMWGWSGLTSPTDDPYHTNFVRLAPNRLEIDFSAETASLGCSQTQFQKIAFPLILTNKIKMTQGQELKFILWGSGDIETSFYVFSAYTQITIIRVA